MIAGYDVFENGTPDGLFHRKSSDFALCVEGCAKCGAMVVGSKMMRIRLPRFAVALMLVLCIGRSALAIDPFIEHALRFLVSTCGKANSPKTAEYRERLKEVEDY
jgi:hypothetical protein